MIDVYTDATPNGLKVSIGLEELGLSYNVHRVFLGGEQLTPEFTELNPNNKIPVLVDDGHARGARVVKAFNNVPMAWIADTSPKKP